MYGCKVRDNLRNAADCFVRRSSAPQQMGVFSTACHQGMAETGNTSRIIYNTPEKTFQRVRKETAQCLDEYEPTNSR
jgi:hypothetical protein